MSREPRHNADVFATCVASMTKVVRCVPVLTFLLASTVSAQTALPAPGTDGTIVAGPVSLRPSFALRDVGIDSNIRDDANDPKQDFTLTAEPRLRAAMPAGSGQLTGSATVGFVYYATYKDEQSINQSYEGRFEGTTSRLRPLLGATFVRARERSGYEIDARVLRLESTVSAGAEFKLTSVTSLTGTYSHSTEDYGDSDQVAGTLLQNQLNHDTDVVSANARFAVTPLTTLSIAAERQRDRFDELPLRNAASVRLLPAVEFAPDAIITGRIAIGFRSFRPDDPRLPPFRGVVGDAKVGGLFWGMTRISVDATRDVDYSFDPLTPYFVLASERLTVSQSIGGPLDVIAIAGLDHLHYAVLEGVGLPGPVDRTRTVGGGIGVRLSPSVRFTVIYDFTNRRSSQFNSRDYDRRRLFGSVIYGI
jgi:hypothetical protein